MKETNSKNSNYRNPIVISLAMHIALIVALLWGSDFSMSEPETSGQMVQAVVIDPNLVKQQAQKIRSQREEAAKKEQTRLDKLKRESEQLEKNRKAEEERIRKLKEQQAAEAKATREAEKKRAAVEKERKAEEARVKKEREKAKKLEAERKLKEAENKRAEEERIAKQKAAIAKAEQERLVQEKAAKEAKEAAERAEKARIAEEKAAKEAAEKARQEKLRLEQLEKERKEQEAALNDIFAGMETENERNSSAQSKFAQSEAARYGNMYKQMIEQNLLIEDSFKGKSCRVNLRLIPAGDNALLGRLSIVNGDDRLCAATKRAVAKVNSFPLPVDQPSVVERLKDINLTVEL
ncbi:cell envelope integrity protein TolA [Vibrio genomosp. F10]|uniref:cell envelope integrity protein TolA n=1 Tax=Vibrio genomosp. F10 TaxID=723171 RepID=UPI00031A629A|nr:cell envelope integrity protein TolA [Vibrio genomosp. F10]OEF08254.1 protein TolA [Vibrio genomosp. F10 str. 9ZB36]